MHWGDEQCDSECKDLITLADVRRRKKELEKIIANMIIGFEQATGLTTTRIGIERHYHIGGINEIVGLELEVEI